MAADIKHFLKHHAYPNIPLNFEEAFELGVLALQGCGGNAMALLQSVTALSALHTRATYAWQKTDFSPQEEGFSHLPQNAAEQVAGVCAAILECDIAKSEFGFLHPQGVPYVVDSCGMGGDLLQTPNVSTISCLIAAAAGIPTCKHGSPANADQGRHGSSDFIELCGINPFPETKGALEASIAEAHFGYAEALDVRFKHIHVQTHELAQLPHMNDIIGPITHPMDPRLMTRKIVGVNHLIPPRVVAEAYLELNRRGFTFMERMLAIRGFARAGQLSGMDEASICAGGTLVAELRDGIITEYELFAEDFGLETVEASAISPPLGTSKGELSLGILKGEIAGPPLEMILANAALLFYVTGQSEDLKKCTQMAREIHEQGLDYQKALEIRARFPR